MRDSEEEAEDALGEDWGFTPRQMADVDEVAVSDEADSLFGDDQNGRDDADDADEEDEEDEEDESADAADDAIPARRRKRTALLDGAPGEADPREGGLVYDAQDPALWFEADLKSRPDDADAADHALRVVSYNNRIYRVPQKSILFLAAPMVFKTRVEMSQFVHAKSKKEVSRLCPHAENHLTVVRQQMEDSSKEIYMYYTCYVNPDRSDENAVHVARDDRSVLRSFPLGIAEWLYRENKDSATLKPWLQDAPFASKAQIVPAVDRWELLQQRSALRTALLDKVHIAEKKVAVADPTKRKRQCGDADETCSPAAPPLRADYLDKSETLAAAGIRSVTNVEVRDGARTTAVVSGNVVRIVQYL